MLAYGSFLSDVFLSLYLSNTVIIITILLGIGSSIVFFNSKNRKSKIGSAFVIVYCVLYLVLISALSYSFSSGQR